MSISHARWALEAYVERLECDLEEEGMGRHQREHWQHQLDDARKGLAELDALEVSERGLLAAIASGQQKREGGP